MLSTEDVHNLLLDLKGDLKKILGRNMVDLVLFGSYSRGDYSEGSDIDLLILVNVEPTRDDSAAVDDLVARYSLMHDVVISALVYTIYAYQKFNLPFFQNARAEGIRI